MCTHLIKRNSIYSFRRRVNGGVVAPLEYSNDAQRDGALISQTNSIL